MKACRICGETKSYEEFHRASGTRDGHRGECKSCFRVLQHKRYTKNREAAIERTKRWRRENPEKYAAWKRRYQTTHRDQKKATDRRCYLTRTYGITVDDYDFLVAAQGGRCALCGRPDDKGLHVDHDHQTGRVRGLLCGKCNKAIGLLDEDPELFSAAVRYLTTAQLPLGCGDREKRPPRPRRKVSS